MKQEICLSALIMFLAIGVSCAEADQSPEPIRPGQAEIDVPADTKVVIVESTFHGCEPTYNASSNTLYVPRCMSPSEQQGPKPTMLERILTNTIDKTGREVESSVQNGIDRKIFEIGNKIDEALGTY